MNEIIVDLPTADALTGKLKKAQLNYLQIGSNLEMKVSRKITFWETDGVTPATDPTRLNRLEAKEVNGTTEGQTVDPTTGYNAVPTFDANGNQTNTVVPELTFWQSLPVSIALTNLPATIPVTLSIGTVTLTAADIKLIMDVAGVKASDVVYTLITQSILSDHAQGFF